MSDSIGKSFHVESRSKGCVCLHIVCWESGRAQRDYLTGKVWEPEGSGGSCLLPPWPWLYRTRWRLEEISHYKQSGPIQYFSLECFTNQIFLNGVNMEILLFWLFCIRFRSPGYVLFTCATDKESTIKSKSIFWPHLWKRSENLIRVISEIWDYWNLTKQPTVQLTDILDFSPVFRLMRLLR